jgi:Sulfotransferase family
MSSIHIRHSVIESVANFEVATPLTKSLYDCLRFAAGAPFSRAYRGRLRWLLETREWEAEHIAAADLRRKALVVPGTGAIYVAVSKAANTSLSFILSTRRGVNENNVHKKRFAPLRLVDTGRTLGDLANQAVPIFTFVRHPIARFWSAFADKIVNARKNLPTERRPGRNDPLFGLVTPEDLIEYIANTPVTEIEEHFRPQWSSTGVERLPITFIGKVETIDRDLKELIARGFLTPEQVERLPRFNATRSPVLDTRDQINERLREIYRKDLEVFGYS